MPFKRLLLGSIALLGSAAYSADPPLARIEPLVNGDEPIIVTHHSIGTAQGPLSYEARAGRLPIRVDETGEVRGWIFFVAYRVEPHGGIPRPLTFAWNGGPLVPSIYLHTGLLGPRRLTPGGFVDNPETLLRTSDLVFYDAVETGFSRPATPAAAQDFMTMTGDVAATAEFIRAYRERFQADRQPLYIIGESYGAWRAAAVTDFLIGRGIHPAGEVLISGAVPLGPTSAAFGDAMNVQARVATAYFYRRLPADLMRNRADTMRRADHWVRETYLPALNRLPSLPAAERDRIARELAVYIGVPEDRIDRSTLVFGTSNYLSSFLGPGRALSELDMRVSGVPASPPGRSAYISHFLRGELGYATDLGYTNELNFKTELDYRSHEAGYVAPHGPGRRSIGDQWTYDQSPTAAAALRASISTGEIHPMDVANPAWVRAAMKSDPTLRVLVATGRFDPTNSCEGEAAKSAMLPSPLRARIINLCYDGGHMMYGDARERVRLLGDIEAFEGRSVH